MAEPPNKRPRQDEESGFKLFLHNPNVKTIASLALKISQSPRVRGISPGPILFFLKGTSSADMNTLLKEKGFPGLLEEDHESPTEYISFPLEGDLKKKLEKFVNSGELPSQTIQEHSWIFGIRQVAVWRINDAAKIPDYMKHIVNHGVKSLFKESDSIPSTEIPMNEEPRFGTWTSLMETGLRQGKSPEDFQEICFLTKKSKKTLSALETVPSDAQLESESKSLPGPSERKSASGTSEAKGNDASDGALTIPIVCLKNKYFDVIVLFAQERELRDFQMTSKLVSNGENISVEEEIFVVSGNIPGVGRVGLALASSMGPIHMACLASRIVSKFEPRLIGTVGVMAGDKEKVKINDVIFPEVVYDKDSGKTDGQKKKPELKPVQCHPDVLKTAKPFLQNSVPKVRFGPTFSGAAFIGHSDSIKDLKDSDRKVLGYEMEALGFYTALHGSNVRYFFLKGVCDYGDDTNEDQQSAAAAASDVAVKLMKKLLEKK